MSTLGFANTLPKPMKRLLLLTGISPLLLACSPSAVIPAEDMEIVCVSGSDSGMKIFLQCPPSINFAGAYVQEIGNTRVVTFLKEEGNSKLPLNAPATTQEEGDFAGTQVITIPFSPGQREQYGEFTVRIAEEDYPVYHWKQAGN
jgi:hypothetical protein